MAVCSFVSLKASYCYYFVFYFILLFFAVYALSIIESAQSEALLSGVKKGPFIRAGMFEMCPKQCSWARLYTHARPHNVYLGYVPSWINICHPTRSCPVTVSPVWKVLDDIRLVVCVNTSAVTWQALSARSFTKRQSGVIHGTLQLSLFNRMCLSVLFFVHHIVWTTSVKE